MINRIQIWVEKWIYKTYKSLDFLPVGCFFKIIETGNLSYLFKLKDYECLPKVHYQPKALWNKIYSEYMQSADGFNLFAYVSDFGNIISKKEFYIKLKHASFLLSIKEDKDLIEIIRHCGYKFEYSNMDQYANCILDLNSQLNGLEKVLELKYEEFQNKYKENNKKVDIYEIINAFEQYKGRKIDIWTTSMREFLTIQKGYKAWIKQKEKENGK